MNAVMHDCTRPDAEGAFGTAHAWTKVPAALTPVQRQRQKAEAAEWLRRRGAVLVAHHCADGDQQDLALETGGCVAAHEAHAGYDQRLRGMFAAGTRPGATRHRTQA